RTWGGEVWLSASNFLADRGIATTGENGVFGPERKWLIEGHGVDPDIVVDNLPHAAFEGKDTQLEVAVKYLQDRIKEKPIDLPKEPLRRRAYHWCRRRPPQFFPCRGWSG